jgi:hypothetical protein
MSNKRRVWLSFSSVLACAVATLLGCGSHDDPAPQPKTDHEGLFMTYIPCDQNPPDCGPTARAVCDEMTDTWVCLSGYGSCNTCRPW